jgi:hypothetical protein
MQEIEQKSSTNVGCEMSVILVNICLAVVVFLPRVKKIHPFFSIF